MWIPALKTFVKKLRGPNAGLTKYWNLFPPFIGEAGGINLDDGDGLFDWELC
jgi:hypothetical protein